MSENIYFMLNNYTFSFITFVLYLPLPSTSPATSPLYHLTLPLLLPLHSTTSLYLSCYLSTLPPFNFPFLFPTSSLPTRSLTHSSHRTHRHICMRTHTHTYTSRINGTSLIFNHRYRVSDY